MKIIILTSLLVLISCNSEHTNDMAEAKGQKATFAQQQNAKSKKEEDCDDKSKKDVEKELAELEKKQQKGLGITPQGGCTLDELK